MDVIKERKIRQELLRSPPPTGEELRRKYHVSPNDITRIKKDMGIEGRRHPSGIVRDRVRAAIESDPQASNYVIARRLGVHQSTVAKYDHRVLYHHITSEENQPSQPDQVANSDTDDMADSSDWKEAARELRAQGKRVREIARELGRNSGDISRAVRGVTPGQATGRSPRRRTRRPTDPDQEVQWMWRQVKELRINLKEALRQMNALTPLLINITETVDVLLSYEPWVKYYTKEDPGYGSLSLFLAERAEIDLDALRTRFREAGDHHQQLLNIIDGLETQVEVHSNGASPNIRQ